MTSTLDRPTRRDSRAAEVKPGGPGARFRGRWRVALRYGARDARRNKGRTALVAVMVALPVAVGVFATTALWSLVYSPALTIRTELGSQFAAGLSYAGPGYLQAPDGSTGAISGDSAEPVAVTGLRAGIAAALPAGSTVHDALLTQLTVVGPERRLSGSALQVDLAFPEAAASFPLASGSLPGQGQVAISASMAREIGLAVGDQVTLDPNRLAADQTPRRATVSGLLTNTQILGTRVLLPGTGPLAAPATVGGPVTDGVGGDAPELRWFVTGDAPVTWDDVLALNALGVNAVSRAVLNDPPPAEAVPFNARIAPDSFATTIRTWGPAVGVVALALLEAVLLIGPAFAVGARRSARSLALVAASGGTARDQRAMLLGTGVVVGVMSSLGATALGLAGGAALLSVLAGELTWPLVPWLPVAGIVVVGVLLAASAAWLPARRASRADVVAVLSGRRGETGHKRWPSIAGTTLAAGGFATAVAGGAAGQPMVLAAGAVAGQIGLVLACGGIVALVGRVAAHLPLTWRFALRDAARNRSRTSPAIAAVLVACAGASAGLVYSASQSLYDYRTQSIAATPGTLMIAAPSDGSDLWPDDTTLAQIPAVAADAVPGTGDLREVRVLRTRPNDDGFVTTASFESTGQIFFSYREGAILGPVVDDGTLGDVFALPDADVARQALRDGRVVVRPDQLFADGTAHLTVSTYDPTAPADASGQAEEPVTIRLPAVAVGNPVDPLTLALPLVPPSVAEAHGLATSIGGFVSTHPSGPSAADVQTIQAALDETFDVASWGGCAVCAGVAEPPRDLGSREWLTTLLIVGGAGLLALAAAWIATALASTESRPDLATLTAVGAAPGTRKRIAAAQAGTITGLGTVVGLASGIALGVAFVLQSRVSTGQADPRWSVVIPWPVLLAALVGLPLIAVTASWLVTRSRLVLTRRVDG